MTAWKELALKAQADLEDALARVDELTEQVEELRESEMNAFVNEVIARRLYQNPQSLTDLFVRVFGDQVMEANEAQARSTRYDERYLQFQSQYNNYYGPLKWTGTTGTSLKNFIVNP